MWCLERLRQGPGCLLRLGDRMHRRRTRQTAAGTPTACANVLTPDRIPEFCIPPRLAPGPTPTTLRNSWEEVGVDEDTGLTDWDPRSQAALSLSHLPRARTAYGFCALLESPHTRRKESLFLGDSGAGALLWPSAAQSVSSLPAHTCGSGDCEGGFPCASQGCRRSPGAASAATPAAPGSSRSPWDAPTSRPYCRLLRTTDRLLGRALRARRSRRLVRARSVSSGDEDQERDACSKPLTLAPFESPPWSLSVPGAERLEAEGTVALGRTGGALRLAAEYCRRSGRLRIRLLRAKGLAGGASEPRALSCRVSLVLQPPGKARKQRSAVVRPSRNPGLDQDFCFEGLTEDEVRRTAVHVKAKQKGRRLERGRPLGQGELLLGSLLLSGDPGTLKPLCTK